MFWETSGLGLKDGFEYMASMAPVVGLKTTAAAPLTPGRILVEGLGHLQLEVLIDGQGHVVHFGAVGQQVPQRLGRRGVGVRKLLYSASIPRKLP